MAGHGSRGFSAALLLSCWAAVAIANSDGPPLPSNMLHADELTALFSDRTVLSRTVVKKRESTTYYHPGGGVRQLRNGKRRFGHWRVTRDDRICLQMETSREKCRIVVKEGERYRKYVVKKDGNHQPTVDYVQFWDGNPFGI